MKLRPRLFSWLLLSALVFSIFLAVVWQGRSNRLLDYGGWKSEKTDLAFGVNGAQSFLAAPNSLAGRSLNLGAWHGHQSMALERSWEEFPALAFQARAKAPGYLVLEIRTSHSRTAIRFSNDPRYPSARLDLDEEGMFQEKKEFSFHLPSSAWAWLRLESENGNLVLREKEQEVARFALPEGPYRFAFRGSLSSESVLDSLEIRSSEEVWREDFSGSFPWFVFLLITGISLSALVLLRRFGGEEPARLLAWMLPSAGAVLLFVYEVDLSRRYPESLDLQGLSVKIEKKEEVLQRLGRPDGRPVVLFIGGSQAWGAGAGQEDTSYFQRLRKRFPAYRFVNGAFSAAGVKDLHEPLELVARQGRLYAVVMVVGVNDTWNPDFPADLEALVAKARSSARKVLLVTEPTELEGSPELNRSLATVKIFPRLSGMHFHDLNSAMKKHSGEGFLWWDFVHLTDAGHRLAAVELEAPLGEILRR